MTVLSVVRWISAAIVTLVVFACTSAPVPDMVGPSAPIATPVASQTLDPDLATRQPTPTLAVGTPSPPAARKITLDSRRVTGAPIAGRFNASAVWTGTEVIVWGGSEVPTSLTGFRSDGAAYDTIPETWRMIADAPLSAREAPLAVWTGQEMLVWGGQGRSRRSDGAAYDPATDSWRRMRTAPIDWAWQSGTTWTGTEWVILTATSRGAVDLAAYDPATDSWRSITKPPAECVGTDLVSAGGALVIASLSGLCHLEAESQAWETVEPRGRGVSGPIAWSGGEIIGFQETLLAWSPDSDTWRVFPPPPQGLGFSQLIWTDERVIVYGSGLAFDFESNEWMELGLRGTYPREGSVMLWAGDRIFAWGGGVGHPPEAFSEGFALIPEW